MSTYIHGCTTSYNGCSITPTQTYKAGEDVTLTLEHQCNKCELLRVEVDGKVINVQDHKIVFEKLSADHVVDVYMTKPIKQAPTLGGQDTEGSYSITVNRYGGDKNFFTSNSRNIALDDTSDGSWSFKWDQKDSTYRLYNIKINGLTQWADGTAPQEGSFDKLKLVPGKNYVIDVYFWDKDDHNQDGKPENVIPDFSRPDQWVHVTTEIVGGAGEIDPGFAEKKTEENKQYEVNYKLENSKDYNNPDYMYYDIESVDVNGQQLTKDQYTTTNDGGNVKVTLKPTTDDAHVKVTVRPVAVPVETMTVSMQTNIVKDVDGNETSRETKVVDPNAGGTIFPSKSVGKYGNYTEIKATPNTVAGYKLKAFEVVDTSDQTKNVAWVWDGSGWQEKKVSDLSQWQLSALSLETEEAGEAEETADEQDVQNAPNQVIVSEPVTAAGDEQAAVAPEAGEATETGNDNGESGADGSAGADSGDPSLVQPAPDEQEVQSPALAEPPALPEEPEFVQNAPEVADAAVYQSESGLELAYAEDGVTNGPGNKENVFYEPVGDDSGATVGYVNLTDKQRVVAYFADSNTSNEDVEKTITKPKHEVRVEFEGAGSLTGTYTGAGAVDDNGSTTLSVGDWPKGYEFDSFEVDNPGNCTPGTMTDNAGKKELALSDITGPVTLKVKLKKTDVDSIKTPTPKSGFDKYYTVEAGVEGYGGLTLERKPSSNTIKEGGKYELSWTPKELDKPISADTNIPCIISFTVNGVEQPSFLGKVTGTGHFTIDAVDNDYMIKIKTVLLNEDVDDDGDPDYNIDDDGDGKPDRNVDTDGDGLPDTNVDTDDDGEPDVNVDTDGDGKPDVNIYDEDLDGTPDNVDPKGTNPPKPNVNVDTDGDGKPDLNVDTDGDGKPDVDIVDEDGDGKPDQTSTRTAPIRPSLT